MAYHASQPRPVARRACLRALIAAAVALFLMLMPAQLAADPAPQTSTFGGLDAFAQALRDEGESDPLAPARLRYRLALHGAGNGIDDPGGIALRFSPSESSELVARGWRTRTGYQSASTRADRLGTMVELARRLGYGARTGALQAGFGTPYELGIATLENELAVARAAWAAAPDEVEAAAWVEELETEIAVIAAAAKPGNGPSARWARADLDVNRDGDVDAADLAALDAGEMPPVLAAGFVRRPAEPR